MRREETNPTTLLTGSTGFIGSGIRQALTSAGHPARLLVRNPIPDLEDVPAGVVPSFGDLTDTDSIAAALQGTTTVIHAASYVGDDQEMQRRVNVEGTRHLVETAASLGVRSFVYVSTFGVYGGDYPVGAAEVDIAPHPRSALSASRREAELIVLDHGGTVIRPALVYGPGDRWFIPPLIKLILSLDAWIDDGEQLVSTIGRDRLGELIVALLGSSPGSGVFHAAHREPIRIRQLADPVIKRLGRRVPTESISVEQARVRLERAGVRESAIQLVTADSWINSEKIWKRSRVTDTCSRPLYSGTELDAYVALFDDPRGWRPAP
ncbi:NAD-dependent epimerase/dehydratase family protein [Agromyces sp. NPDC058104]|uniref:NAD-dependent epimerase/dehydratase family protein n=1 Tax=Agromyces sp. NPDC058104 TaxID=3346342 RepID=UPI0036D84186